MYKRQLVSQFGLDSPVVLLTGSMTAKQKREAYERLENEKNALIIGTHAPVSYTHLDVYKRQL